MMSKRQNNNYDEDLDFRYMHLANDALNTKVKNQKEDIENLQERIKKLEKRLEAETAINMAIYNENLKLLYERDQEKDNLKKLLRYLTVVFAVQQEMNDCVTGDTTSEYIRLAVRYANVNYLKNLLSLTPMSDDEEDIEKVEKYKNKLRKEYNDDEADRYATQVDAENGTMPDLDGEHEDLFR